MPTVTFTKNLQRHIDCEPQLVSGSTLREVFDQLFQVAPKARHYVLNDQGHIRKHVAVAINGDIVSEKQQLQQVVPPNAEIYIAQALSGG